MNFLNGFINTGADGDTVQNMPISEYKDQFGIFTKAACVCVAFTNDMKHIHLHAVGKDFDKTHNLAGDFYDKASEECDYLSEMAMEYKEDVPNFSDAAVVVEWIPLRQQEYRYKDALLAITDKLKIYVNTLLELRNTSGITDDVSSKIDDMVRDWNVELQYKLSKRAEGSQEE